MAGVLYVGLKFLLPTIEFQSPVFRGLAISLPHLAWVFPSILFAVAALSAFNAWQKGELLDRQTNIRSVKELPWQDFESLVGEAYRRKGYRVQENTGTGPDGGIDLTVTKDSERHLVQCKNWKTKAVGVPIVRELYGVVTAENASGGIIVCSGSFTQDAIEFARGKPIELVGGPKLTQLIGDVQKQKQAKPVSYDSSCPTCGNSMVMRTARRGKTAGSRFWGCSRFPKCRGTRQIDV